MRLCALFVPIFINEVRSMERIIEVKGNGGYISMDKRKAGNQHEANSTKLRITLDQSWDGYAKTVTFWDAKGQHPVKRTLTADLLEDADGNTHVYLCPIPGEALAESGMMTFTIDGYVNGVRQRTVGAELEVTKSPYEESAGEPTDPTPSQAEQLQVQIDHLLGDIRADAAKAEAAAVAADQARIEAERARDASLEIAGGEHVTMKDLEGKANVVHASQHKTGGPDPLTAADVGAVPVVATYYTTTTAMSADDLTVPFAVIPLGPDVNPRLHAICGGTFAYVYTGFYIAAEVTSRRMQIAVTYNSVNPKIAMRIYAVNGWLEWREIADTDYAVNKKGDTMTGNLGILTGTDPSVFAKNSNTERIARVVSYGDKSVRLENHKDGLNYAGIDIRTEGDSLDGIVRLVVLKNGVWNPYDILHEGNMNLITPAAIGAARIETGTYEGTGKAGSLYPNSLTFGFEPTVVMLGGYGVPNGVVFFKGMTETTVYANTFSQNIRVSFNGNTISWHNLIAGESSETTTYTMGQLNMLGETYTFVALG